MMAATANEVRGRRGPANEGLTSVPEWLAKASEEPATVQQGLDRLEEVLQRLDEVIAAQEAGLEMLVGPAPEESAGNRVEAGEYGPGGQVGRFLAQVGRLARSVAECERLTRALNRRLA